ncbi:MULTISPECIES: 1,6-anhydro-N-acetylmuramyl-L-alanine amidase AmpD [Methylomonas]|uniref:1,6-anhydro-N-acetylmuramyl-L-alanine amidase AmpD n=2 Tax=Methylomonas TaxID=416 RepID=A0A126T378_9GAMM|nr:MULTISPECIES: 1,6-anhydro-N-acetylmuramyl-L-alanine amidase AmpD [Methylomonas]AMK76551.1 N-acetyl-anhydromuranmyl-L-alanine amidase [Methylomonas denitrificans]OAI08134.1 N-acetyl-anhydromuranmyl-L-alanine amidase [Methylomonas methanica]TCV88593.1 AmpD protein [Methylomonas methanica]
MMIRDHYLNSASQVASPNCDDRPDPDDISLLVIHCISLPPEQFEGEYIDQLFCNDLNPSAHPYFQEIHQLRVSAHLLIRRDGSIRQYVPFNRRAWHAGVSKYQDRERCNDFSIGIELEGAINLAYTDIQYRRLADVCRALLTNYPQLSNQRIVGHSDIAPDRKTDPGPFFDWHHFHELLDSDAVSPRA